MTSQAPQKPGPGGMANDAKDPTQQMPPNLEAGGSEEQRIREQQHTGNHQKPGDEARGADVRGGTRAGAENVEPTGKPEPKDGRVTG
ncbi:hypothetical protein [Indioceanicola profundi]|uniref:hypothetical protein n=1 Tax=Indioceanicola profundi TaxID=2220096 RepID=UPI001CEDAD5D|nr:hypothetical protein [Indioceanicola profundi]